MDSTNQIRPMSAANSVSNALPIAACVIAGLTITALIGYDPRLGTAVTVTFLSAAIVAVRLEWLVYAIVAMAVIFIDGWLPTRLPDDVIFRIGIGRLYLMEIPIYLLLLGYAFRRWINETQRTNGFFPRTPLDRPLYAWLLAFPIFAAYGVLLGNPLQDAAGYYEWRCLLLGILFFFLVTGLFRRDRDRLRLFWWFFGCAAAKAFYSLFLLFSHVDPPFPLIFGAGPIGEGPENVMFVFAALPAIAVLVLHLEKNWQRRTWLILGIVALVANVVLSSKRDPQLGFAIGCLVIGWYLPLKDKAKWAACVTALVLVVLAVGAVTSDTVKKKDTSPSRYEEIVNFISQPGENMELGDTFAFHILDLVDAWNTIKQRPLMGFGFGGQTQRELTLLGGVGGSEVATGIIHNQYLTFWLKMGLAGPALFLWLVGSFLRYFHTASSSAKQHSHTGALALGCVAAIYGDLGMEFWGAGWIANTKTPLLIFLLMAIAVGFLAQLKRQNPLVARS